MATPGKLKMVKPQADVWSLKERLALVCSVMRSGDQNWVSVSRAIRPFGEPNRPPDWFSQKNCAMQYSQLLETVETPKRKRSEKSEIRETPGVVIARKVTIERIEELKTLVKEEQERYRKLKSEVEMIRAGQLDDKLKDMWTEMESQRKDSSGASTSSPHKLPDQLTPGALAAKSALFNKIKRETAGLKLKMPSVEQDETSQDSLAESNGSADEVQLIPDTLSIGGATSFATMDIKQETDGIPSGLLSDLLESSPALQRALNETKAQLKQKDLKAEFDDLEEQVVVVEEGAEVIVDDLDVKQECVEVEVTESEEVVKMEVDVVSGSVSDVVEVSTSGTEVRTDSVTLGGEVVVKTDGERKSAFVPTSIAVESEDHRDDVDVESVDDGDDSKTGSADVQQVEVITPDAPDTPIAGGISLSSSAIDLEEPPSPASSVVSNETDTGSTRGRPIRRSRSGKTSRKYQRRPYRRRYMDDDRKESESSKPSEAESSDDDGAPNESDDTGSNATSKHLNVTDSVPNSPASMTHSDIEDEKAHKNWKKSIMLVWRSAANHKYANVFLHQVTEDIAPGYGAVVNRPMDLVSIKRNIDNASIRTTSEFQRDMMLMFTNAIMYNSANHDVFKMATEMYDDVMMHIEQYVSTQMMVQSEAKVLRASSRTRSDVTSDKEEDPKKRKVVPAPEPESGGKKKRKP